jgi:hypothetical protein
MDQRRRHFETLIAQSPVGIAGAGHRSNTLQLYSRGVGWEPLVSPYYPVRDFIEHHLCGPSGLG